MNEQISFPQHKAFAAWFFVSSVVCANPFHQTWRVLAEQEFFETGFLEI
jgi:hypothetical protein